ncbi:hypothetical protein SCP_1601450 [Sparassis crispa]|uniref:CxC2-like cysteine cluster KDZ transposase-associated domain-containing protein n=1 Tax=Sparassis crispa TaxID=139825 RepID=A0A401H501_9APHY|nr:hypothetical protein SCP_1601450 [Sparassis crispa]GBE89483.1 hypothetical protein SCP_1601450 [Sparassis crispa]
MTRRAGTAKGITFHASRRKVAIVSKKMEMDDKGRHFLANTQVRYTPESPAKKRKVSCDSEEGVADAGPSEVQTAEPDIVMHEGSPKQPAATTGQVKNWVSRVLAEWTPRLHDLLTDLLSAEAHLNIPGTVFCGACISKAHRHDPFHWIDLWNGEFFEKVNMGMFGYILYLGHHGQPCPDLVDRLKPSKFVVMHNGIHKLAVHWCHCAGAPERILQMLHARLFPTTLDHPESAFTVVLLKEWHMHALTSKKGVYDYMYAIRHLTNNSAPHTVKNQYKEFNIVSQIWRYITMMKRSGNFHGMALPNRDPQSLTVPCFTCPWPGMNMPQDWRQTPAVYIHTCELSGDGNHGLQKKRKHDDLNDVSLGLGQGYFVHPDKMSEYMDSIEAEPAPETCSGFKVARAQRPGKFCNLDVSGVIAVICIRHGCFRPAAMVDLQKGERFGHMDFALAGALAGLEELQHIIFTYDVACIYKINILKCFGAHFPQLVPLLDRIQMLLPKMHMLAHKEACQVLYVLCYTWGTGLMHGESVEHPWAEHNQAGLSTCEMGAGHRHDALNDIHNYWNWRKVENVGAFLTRKVNEAFKGQEEKTQLYDALTEVAGVEKVSTWQWMDVDPKQKGKQVESVYLLNDGKVPTTGHAYQELTKMEIQPRDGQMDLAVGKAPSGAMQFLKTALQLEQRQLALESHLAKHKDGDNISISESASLEAERRGLRRDIDKWRHQQVTFMPKVELPDAEDVEDDEDDEMHGRPESEALALPSNFSGSEHQTFGLEILATFERRIRMGQAYNLLSAIKESLQHQGAFLSNKTKHARGQKDNTRAQRMIQSAAEHTRSLMRRYNHNRQRLIDLGMDDGDSPLRTINLKKDLTIKNVRVARSLGDSKEVRAWFWNVAPPGATAQDVAAWAVEVEQVEWFQASAEKARHNEEVNKLHKEFQ